MGSSIEAVSEMDSVSSASCSPVLAGTADSVSDDGAEEGSAV